MNDSFDIKTYMDVLNYPCELQVGDILLWFAPESKYLTRAVMITAFYKTGEILSFTTYDITHRRKDIGERDWFRYWKIIPINKCTKSGCACRGNTGC